MSKAMKIGCITHKSIAKAALAAQKFAKAKGRDISYMTIYMRLREGWTPSEAAMTPVRKYNKKAA